ncbi:histidine kinase [Polaribacter glomeratus]|uniref:histidine kinase n=1 Tax=Polaribacter glomeratus TaxID=102 RepID=A0A2S7WJY0_9FLAO|nr:histidine kinase [Polaribacter glomeratus]TXD67635.1 hybrid sensor histidine kinase/response regulator [Polaribacter glomeratus]
MYTILIVEDTLAIRDEIFDILIMEGYIVFKAENGKVGFEMALKENPDLIISDILMPNLSGFEMLDKLQKHQKTRDIPLIFLSAKGKKEDIRIGMNLGAEDYLTKPIEINNLLNAVENKLKKKVLRDQKVSDKTATLNAILENQKNELENYSHLISHELKSSVRNVSDLLAWTKEEAAQTNNFENSSLMIELMQDKIEKMELLLVRIELYKNITPACFRDRLIYTDTLVERVANKIEKPSHISIKIKNKLPNLFADEKMLEKLFEILIQNAVNHIDKEMGFIEIDCKITKKDYLFSIKDNGVGIHEKYHKKIFEMFQTVESNKSLGIGLSIVEKIISNYKGKIHVESIPQKQTIFYFNIPITNNYE